MAQPDSLDADGIQDWEQAAKAVSEDIERRTAAAGTVSNATPKEQTHNADRHAGVGISGGVIHHLDHSVPVGNVTPSPQPESAADDPVSRAKALSASVMNRLKAEKRWFGLVDLERDQMMREAKAAFPDLVQRQLWVYGELDRMYPPAGISALMRKLPDTAESGDSGVTRETASMRNLGADSGAIVGLSSIPADWPDLPSNASLASEVGWVQANRLWIVEERPGAATVVRLDRAASPAPSRATLGWLETSIRSYAKYVDVVARASTGAEEEGAVLKRERKSIEEMKALLAEMEEAAGVCPSCGKPF